MGRAVVERLLAAGARVTVLDPELPGELDTGTEGLELVEGDVRRREDVRKAVARQDGVDVVVAVAGIGALTPLLEIDDATWQRMLDVNLTGVFLTVQEGARAMAETGRPGAIVVVSSTNAIYAEESTVPYTTTKGALVAMVRAASLDLARHGIRINAVAPGMVRTRMAAPLTEDATAAQEFLRNVPLARFAEPDEIASVVTFLLTEESSYVTGSLVVADGGLTVGMKLDEELLRVHDADSIEALDRTAAAGGGMAAVNVPVGVDSVEIARLAAGGAIAAVDAVLDGSVDNAYCLLRPPGHHATPSAGRGFCLLNNVAVAVAAARARGAGRVAVVDWDVHHGNGTQDAFLDDPAVLTVSLHQDRLFPAESGGLDENDAANLNVPLPPGCGEGAYLHAMRTVVVPAVRAFAPDLIVVACGFDASALDPLGRMQLRAGSFARLAREVLDLGRVVCCHEGGYSEYYVPFCVVAVLDELTGSAAGVGDPYFPPDRELAYDALQEHQRRAIDAARG